MGAIKKNFTSKVASNGQVVVPLELRVLLSLKGGDSIVFLAEQDESGLIKVMLRKPNPSFKNMVGSLKSLSGRPVKNILKEIDDEDMQ
jgi:AbrB family looped-hinge helix DNA binding protein